MSGNVVHSVNIMILILVISVTVVIAYIFKYAFEEMNDGSDDPTKQEELLQLPSDRDQQSS
ncbi:hypothetical protein PTIM40_120 [Cyanophage P-TIM40]|uniref:Uncharacterized protein n=1 Tax=Cyanophage P-TIM40 TaxID=1589733 RepID=A0A0C5ADZ0_9CAUD|nr:hypothetical protein AU107_gp120 [Cyanophage P-TIM40]AJK27547.1 hypothetical protein PTIM40_120 [Cyanophage P-TIM40]